MDAQLIAGSLRWRISSAEILRMGLKGYGLVGEYAHRSRPLHVRSVFELRKPFEVL